jgi:TatD DNase family protein
MMQLAKRFPDACIPMIGLHPTSVGENYNDQLDFYEQKLAGDHNFIAIGEIGIDLYWETKYVLQQKEAFARQIELAKRMQLPVVIHARESFREIFDILDKMDDENLSGVFHSFTGTLEEAEHILSYKHFKIGIGGIVTFKNAGLDKVVQNIDMNHIVLETDSPYLAPVPRRGKRNESSYIKYIAKKLADIHSISIEEVASVTTKNAKKVFRIN